MLVCVDTIYVDSLLFLNLAADYLLLLASGRAAGAVLHRRRILIAAVLGALYALAAVLPGCGFLTRPAAKIALGIAMSLIAFGSERRFWRCCVVFFAISALFGGAVWALGMFAGYDAATLAYVPVNTRVLIFGFAICYAAVTLLMRGTFSKRARRVVPLELTLGHHHVTLRALLDTGNTLSDPVTGRSVIVADAAALAPLLGRIDVSDAAMAAEELSALPGLAMRVSLVPYRAVGVSASLLAAVRPDAVTLDGAHVDALVALWQVSGKDFDAIAPAGL